MDSLAAHLTLIIGIPVFVLLAATVITIVAYGRWSSRTVRTASGHAWSTACVDPRRPAAPRTLCLEDDGLTLRGARGKVVAQWPWMQIVEAVEGPVRPFNAVVSHQGLILHLTDGSTMGFLFPSRSTLRYPPQRLEEALREVSGRVGAARSRP